MKRRILVVDDEPGIREVLQAYLTSDGFDAVCVGNGADALAKLKAQRFDVVLCDLGLPDMDGLDVVRKAHDAATAYVIVVSARAEEFDKLLGLSVGADDYVTKPFSPREVVARVKAVLRRGRLATEPTADDGHEFNGLSIDGRRREVRVDDEPVELSALDFDILLALASEPGRVFSRAQLLERVWGGDFFGDDRVVDVHIRAIRAALKDPSVGSRFIGTVRGVGYKFLAERA